MSAPPRRATRVERLASAMVDFFLLITAYSILWSQAWVLQKPFLFSLVVNLMFYFAYHVGIPRSRLGTTPGKYMWGLVVVDAQYGRPLNYHRMVARAFYALWPAVPFLLYYYYFSPHLLSEMYEYRVGSLKLWHKIQSGVALTDVERIRWRNFQNFVQTPLTEMCFNTFLLTCGTLTGAVLALVLHPRVKALHDVICQTSVIKKEKTTKAAA